MKRVISLVLTLVMLLGLCSVASAAPSTQYSSTRLFLQKLDEMQIKYSYVGIDNNGYEKITVKNRGSDIDLAYTLTYFFDENDENASIRVWDLITFDSSSALSALYACNNCHLDWKYVTFAVEGDNTITAKMDLIYRGESVSEVMWEATLHMVNVVSDAYPAYLGALQK